jgi:hypothetical protein
VAVAVVEQLVGLHQLAVLTGQRFLLAVVLAVHTTHHTEEAAVTKDQATVPLPVVLATQTQIKTETLTVCTTHTVAVQAGPVMEVTQETFLMDRIALEMAAQEL